MGEAVRFGIRIPPCGELTEVARVVKAAEDAGFDTAWIPDSQLLWRDVWAALAVAATATSRIRLGTCVTNFATRHPTVTAAAAATTAELAPGRFVLGVGTGDSAVRTVGLPRVRLAAMREHLRLVRTLLDGGEVIGADGRVVRLMSVPKTRVPIYLAVSGPRTCRLAGELCDGTIGSAMNPAAIARTRGWVAEAAAAVGRDPAEVEICVHAQCHPADDPAAVTRLVKPFLVHHAQLAGRKAVREAYGIDIDPPAHIPGIHPDMGHAMDWGAAVEVAGQWVSDEAAARYAAGFVIGRPAELAAKFQSAVDAGARSFYIRHLGSYTFPTELIEVLGEWVIPNVAVR
ncbi:MAG TPA: LLM class flavin-dependent oxidoreductase [Natronosporangium sp.]